MVVSGGTARWISYVVVWSASHVQLFVMPGTAACQTSLSLTISQILPKFMFIASVMPSSHLIHWHLLLLLLTLGFCCSVAQLCLTLYGPTDCSTPRFPVPHHMPKFMFIALVMLSSHLIPWHPLLLLPSVPPRIRDSSNELSVRIQWPKYWSFSFSISPSREYSGLISPKVDWFDLLAVQGTFRNHFQHHSSKVSILWRSAFFTVQLSQLYMTTGKPTALIIQTFVSRVLSLLFNTLSRLVITFLTRSNHLLI